MFYSPTFSFIFQYLGLTWKSYKMSLPLHSCYETKTKHIYFDDGSVNYEMFSFSFVSICSFGAEKMLNKRQRMLNFGNIYFTLFSLAWHIRLAQYKYLQNMVIKYSQRMTLSYYVSNIYVYILFILRKMFFPSLAKKLIN